MRYVLEDDTRVQYLDTWEDALAAIAHWYDNLERAYRKKFPKPILSPIAKDNLQILQGKIYEWEEHLASICGYIPLNAVIEGKEVQKTAAQKMGLCLVVSKEE